MDIGVFIPIGNNGWLISETAPQYMPSFELNKTVVQSAEKYGFDFALSMIKLRGFGGKTRVLGAQSGELHPDGGPGRGHQQDQDLRHRRDADHAARRSWRAWRRPSIPSPGPGRFGINLITGWQKAEYDQMGLWPGESHYKDRYNYLAEYATVLKELMETGVSDFKGQYLQMDDCRVSPKPHRREDHLRRLQRRGPGLHRSVCGLFASRSARGPTRPPPSRRSTPGWPPPRPRPAATSAPTSCS